MARLPFRNPQPKLPDIVLYFPEDEVFLNLLKEWTPDMYKPKGLGRKNNARIRKIKEDLRQSLLFIQDEYCAFCGIDLNIARRMDREHIAPQAQYPMFIFEQKNIVMACYDCNDAKKTNNSVQTPHASYSDVIFNILHPFRDDYDVFLSAHYEDGGLFFQTLPGVTDQRAANTIQILGLDKLKFVKERGMRIRNIILRPSAADDAIIRAACSIQVRQANNN